MKKQTYSGSPKKSSFNELSLSGIITGVLLAVIFGAANAYLGLRVGMTVSASIPAAVIAMSVSRFLLSSGNVLNSNMIQTIGSAGESLAAGAIFTIPALYLWAKEGLGKRPDFLEVTFISVIGGLLGVLFMIPLRKALIVKEHGVLPYPEGTACAKVLLAGEKNVSGGKSVFAGMGFSAFFKFIIDGLKLVPGEINFRTKGYYGEFGTQIYPAVMSVGYICGPKTSSYLFAGGIISSLVLIPCIVLFGKDIVMYPSEVLSVGEIYANSGADGIWSNYIRYIGAGALSAGGIISLIKSFPIIINAFSGAVKGFSFKNHQNDKAPSVDKKDADIPLGIVFSSIVALALLIFLLPQIPISFLGTIIVVIFGFFFATVSSRMVGLVGSSNNPVSGMAIATLLITCVVFKLTGKSDFSAMASAVAIGSVICIIASIAGDTSQDLKTGFLLGATPKKQQLGQIIGVVASSLAISGTLNLLDAAWGFGSEELSAPQASLMKMLIEGVMSAKIDWTLVFIGVFIALTAEILKIPVLPFAIGIYLPSRLTACIMIGGIIRYIFEKSKAKPEKKKRIITDGILYSSGMIAGEGLIGIFLAILAISGVEKLIDLSFIYRHLPQSAPTLLGIIALIFIIISFPAFALFKKQNNNEN